MIPINDYVAGYNKMRSKKDDEIVFCYTENYISDNLFWNCIISKVQTFQTGVKFEIKEYKQTDKIYSGKKNIVDHIENQIGLGKYVCACIDADYETMLDVVDSVFVSYINKDYVFHTYAHSRENFQCCLKNIDLIGFNATKCRKILTERLISSQIIEYCETIFDVFLLHITRLSTDKSLPNSELNQIIDPSLSGLDERCKDYLKRYEHVPINRKLVDFFPNKENIIYFIEGHFVKETIVPFFAAPIIKEAKVENHKIIKGGCDKDLCMNKQYQSIYREYSVYHMFKLLLDFSDANNVDNVYYDNIIEQFKKYSLN